ncbi:Transcriptional regulator [Cryomyces antarcticus]|nr:Transcriptional regulator [Cryomyces antarcticus]
MPPTAAKGKGKVQSREPRRSHSRNTTPISTNTEGSSASTFATGTSSYLHTSLAQLLVPTNTTLEGMIDRHGNATNTPSASSLNTMEESLRTNILAHVKARGDICDRGMRELAKRRKERMEIERERDLDRERLERESEEKRAKLKKAKSSLKREREEERPMALRKLLEDYGPQSIRDSITRRSWTVTQEVALITGLALVPNARSRFGYKELRKLHGDRGTVSETLRGKTGLQSKNKGRGLKTLFLNNHWTIPVGLQDVEPRVEKLAIPYESPRKRETRSSTTAFESFSKGTMAPPAILLSHASSLLSSPASAVPPAASTGVTANDSATSPSNSESSHQPPPAPAVPQHYLFGADPSKFLDDTVYHIRELTPGMTEEEKKAILCVSHYPQSDLHDLTPGTPPDRDFSNGKVPNQVNFEAFSKYLESYIRPLTEEDVAFLKERGDRLTPYVMPRRGARHYKEIWAEEDGAMAIDLPNQNDLPPNEPRGSLEQMNDDVAETDEISTGPVLARLLATMRHTSNPNSTSQLHIGDTDVADTDNPEQATDANAVEPTFRPATYMPETSQPGWKPPPTPGPDYATMDERLKLELRHIGFLSDSAEPDYDGHYDDEVAARLRFLQSELKRVSALNGARKARLLELAEERMAGQEYGTIADDLDNQLNQAYLKRNRNIGKGKNKTKRPGAGGAAGGAAGLGTGVGVSRQSVGEPIRQLMERKRDWNSIIGPVVGFGAASIPKGSVFDEESMARLMKKEEEGLMEVEE